MAIKNFGQNNDRSLTEVLTKKNYDKVLPRPDFRICSAIRPGGLIFMALAHFVKIS